MQQNTDEWLLARCGSLGASQVADAIAKTKSGWGASRANLASRIVVERLTGVPTESFTNAAMEWGKKYEADARDAYAFFNDVTVDQVAIVKHPAIVGTHASPDGLIELDGLVEIKAPQSATHIETLLNQKIPAKYVTQIMWQLACTGRQWCDFVSFDPRMPEAMRLFVKRLPRDLEMIQDLEIAVHTFLAEVADTTAKLQEKYGA